MIGQRTHTAKKEVAAQPVCLHPLTLLQQDGAIGDGPGLVAHALACGKPRFDRIHAAQAHGEKHQSGEHPDSHALKESEVQDHKEDQQNNAVL